MAELEAWRDLMDRNILGPAKFRAGLLRFGGNTMQLDNQGLQVATEGVERPAILLNASLIDDPTNEPDTIKITGNNTGTTNTGRFWATEASGTAVARVSVSAADTAIDQSTVQLLVVTGGSNSHYAELQTQANITYATFSIVEGVVQPLMTSDPSSPVNGYIWYNDTTDLLKARINGATVTLGAASLLTSTDWAAAGDLVVGTGNDTAAILSASGAQGWYLRSDTTTATGLAWNSILIMSNQSSGFTTSEGRFYRCSGTFTATLQSSPNDGTWVSIKNVGSGIITVARGGSDTIFTMASGQTSFTILPGEAYQLIYYISSAEWEAF